MKNFSYHLKENIKPMVCFFIAGFLVACGFGAADWLMPKKPVEYRICVQDAGGDYMCEVYK
jgi:hypothetical protein